MGLYVISVYLNIDTTYMFMHIASITASFHFHIKFAAHVYG